ncbi:hypothetical protein BGZ94_009208 [Podila epigama]|nr:hypothetical protein BGZ94_009208 [Podila epigama]
MLTSRFLLLLLLACTLLFTFSAQAQDTPEPTDPEDPPEDIGLPTPTPSPSPSPLPSTSPSPSPSVDPSTPTQAPAPAPAPNPHQPNPIFSSSDDCVTCERGWPTVRNCSALIPPPTVNLTLITQVLPFYNCICPGSGVVYLHACSTCFRSTGQQSFLNPKHYIISNQDERAYTQVCLDTENGSKIPSSASSLWDLTAKSASWSLLPTILTLLVINI